MPRMCLAIPMEIVERDDADGTVELGGVRRRVSLIDRIPDVDEELTIVTRGVHRGEHRMPHRVGAERIRAELETLRDNLASGNPDGNMIRHLLLSMASHTATLAGEPSAYDRQMPDQLRHLANALRNFSSQF